MTSEAQPESLPLRIRTPSQGDVARLAGVSDQTVSRVANGRHNVDAATRDRVLTAMRELGYRPNRAARALRKGAFRSIGVIFFELTSVGSSHTLDAIAAAATSNGYGVNLLPVLQTSQSAVSSAFNLLGEQAVDGVIILIAGRELDDANVQLPDGLPVVVIDSAGHYDYPIVDNDHTLGARLATEHLLDLGHETVWHIGGPPASFSAARRQDSWRSTLLKRGRKAHPPLIGDWSAESGYELGRQLADQPDVTAVLAANDQMALGLLHALHERDRRVPHDISVIGFDDVAESAHFWPPLTTVRQSFAEVGNRSVAALMNEIQTGQHRHQSVTVPTELVIRSTTAPPSRTRE
jgi:DNA-binding LacI/PurR family transcriptional regulator